MYLGTPEAPFAEILFAEKNVAESGGKPVLFAEKFCNIVFDVLPCKSKKDSDPRCWMLDAARGELVKWRTGRQERLWQAATFEIKL